MSAKRKGEPLSAQPPDLPSQLVPTETSGDLVRSEFEGCFFEGVDLANRDVSRAQLVESRLDRVDLSGCAMKGASLRDVFVEGGSWANARASSATFSRVHFSEVRMTGANLSSAVIKDTTFSECRIDLGLFRFASLERVAFENCRMDEIDFYDAKFLSALFVNSEMTGATLSGATFARSEIRGCELAGVKNPEQLRGVRMPWLDVVNSAAELAVAVGIEIIRD